MDEIKLEMIEIYEDVGLEWPNPSSWSWSSFVNLSNCCTENKNTKTIIYAMGVVCVREGGKNIDVII